MKEAVEAGASVETAIDTEGATSYHWGAFEGHFEIMEWLARKGADHSARDKLGNTPMHYAACKGHVAALERLATHGADIAAVDVSGSSAIHMAIQRKRLKKPPTSKNPGEGQLRRQHARRNRGRAPARSLYLYPAFLGVLVGLQGF
jgi:ankyrin repeat protein